MIDRDRNVSVRVCETKRKEKNSYYSSEGQPRRAEVAGSGASAWAMGNALDMCKAEEEEEDDVDENDLAMIEFEPGRLPRPRRTAPDAYAVIRRRYC